jgi:ADP-dependent phosphofructokinase/glucokinase
MLRIGRLDRFKHLLSEQRTARNVIHLELASIGDKTLMKNILDAVKIHYEITGGEYLFGKL